MSSSIAASGCWRLLIATLLLGGIAAPLQAQNIVDGLPPPPNLPTIQPALPPEFTGPASPTPAVPTPTVRPPAATPADRPATTRSSAYLVYVNGDSPLLLAQVRRVQANAFVDDRDGEQVIQAGVFSEEDRARQQVIALEQQGIIAEMRRITRSTLPPTADRPTAVATNNLPPDLLPEVPVNRQVEFGQPLNSPAAPTSDAVAQASDRVAVRGSAYYVVVPGRRSNLPDIANLVTLLGGGLNVTDSEVQELGSPRGPHVLVGPFVDRRTASRWNRYFRDFGLDARVYYRR